jgi:YVTN family beta-propeller protein
VYVPNETTNDVVVIDPGTFRIIARYRVGRTPEHITPDWAGRQLYVEDMNGSTLTVIDPRSGRPTGATLPVPYPYNLYFSLDGSTAISVQDFLNAAGLSMNGLRFYDRRTWRETGWLPIPFSGANHLDLSADGSFLMLSGESSGMVGKVDLRRRQLVGTIKVGGSPTDVRLSPDGRLFFVANQITNGVDVLDPMTMRLVAFIPTGVGAHGLAFSRDTKQLYVTNRLAGSVSVIDVASRRVVATWRVGGSPDMVSVSPNGRQLWISNRYNGTVEVIDSVSGRVLATIATGGSPHGLSYWPQPGGHSIGHNGNMR